jgi:predicted dienelactone hydrolase
MARNRRATWVLPLVLLAAGCSGGGGDRGDADSPGDLSAEAETEAAGEADADLPAEAEAEAGADAPPDGLPDAEVEEDVEEADDGEVEVARTCAPPDERGPYPVGVRDFAWRDSSRGNRNLPTKVWYPAEPPPPGTATATYGLLDILPLLHDTAYPDLPVAASGVPYPLVLFSHGNKGINYQSFTYTSHLASHGFIVAAPNHTGNTLFDNPSDEQIAQAALDRPLDIAFVRARMTDANADPASPLFGAIDTSIVGVTGHSFGGYTTLVLGGGEVDRDAAVARCAAGVPGDVFCPYVGYWPAGMVGGRPPEMADVLAAVALAPGGFAAFGDEGLALTTVPTMLMGGTIDEYTLNDLQPCYLALPPPKAKVVIENMSHMGFTDICRIPLVSIIPTLGDMCSRDGRIGIDRGFAITNTFATAFLCRHLLGDEAMDAYLTPEYAVAVFPDATFEAVP